MIELLQKLMIELQKKYILVGISVLILILVIVLICVFIIPDKSAADKSTADKSTLDQSTADQSTADQSTAASLSVASLSAAEQEALKLNWVSIKSKNIFWPGFGIAYGNGLWIGIGTSSAKNLIGYSRNGYNWDVVSNKNIFNNGNSESGQGIAFGKDDSGKDLWVSVGLGTNNTIATSPDGFIWSGKGTSIFSDGKGVAFGKDDSGKDLWVTVGSGDNHGIAISSDGIKWTGLGQSIIYSGYNVAYGNSLWVSVGMGDKYSIATSSNGKNWIGVTGSYDSTSGGIFSTGIGISYGKDDLDKDLWVAVGEGNNSIATSHDGKTWSGLGKDIFIKGNSVTFGKNSLGKNLWVAVGEGNNSIATSYDGKTWLGLGTDIFLSGNSVAFGKDGEKNLLVAVGSDGGEGKFVESSIATSPI